MFVFSDLLEKLLFINDYKRGLSFHTCKVSLTYGDIRGAVCLQEAVEVVPGARHPLHDAHQLRAPRAAADLRLQKLPSQVAAQETLQRLGVVGAQNPPVGTQALKFRTPEAERAQWMFHSLFQVSYRYIVLCTMRLEKAGG